MLDVELMKLNDSALNVVPNDLQQQYVALVEQKDALDKQLKELKEIIFQKLNDENIKSLKTDYLTITIIDESFKESFDEKRFKAENPKLYDSYITLKTSPKTMRILTKKKGGE